MLDSKWYHYVILTYSNKVINQPFLVHKPFLLLFSVYKFTFFLSYKYPASLIFITTFSTSIVNTHKIIINTTFNGIISPFNIKFIINHTGRVARFPTLKCAVPSKIAVANCLYLKKRLLFGTEASPLPGSIQRYSNVNNNIIITTDIFCHIIHRLQCYSTCSFSE